MQIKQQTFILETSNKYIFEKCQFMERFPIVYDQYRLHISMMVKYTLLHPALHIVSSFALPQLRQINLAFPQYWGFANSVTNLQSSEDLLRWLSFMQIERGIRLHWRHFRQEIYRDRDSAKWCRVSKLSALCNDCGLQSGKPHSCEFKHTYTW